MIETERLIVRPWQESDVDAWYAIVSDPVTMQFWPAPLTQEDAARWIAVSLERYAREGFGRNALLLKETGELIGDCGIVSTTLDGEAVYDLGYILHHPYHRQGIGLEVASALRDYGFSVLNLPAIHANMAHDHTASRRVAEKIGMTLVRTFDNPRNRNIRTLLYRLSNPAATPTPA